MNVPTETKVWVGLWLTVAAFNLVVAVANATTGDWGGAWDAFALSALEAFIASLIYERDKAREFRNQLTRTLGGSR